MNRTARTGLVLGIVSATGVLLLAIAASERKSPGPISAVHARIAEIDGGQACSSCHGGWFGDMRGACSSCHDDVATQIEDGRGLHGSFADDLVRDCASCHGEHHGEAFRPVNALAFSLAGVPDSKQFDHRLVGFAMDGAHLQLQCAECHQNADVEVLAAGQQRFLGLSKDCGTCHADPHGGRMQFGCGTCHSQTEFAERYVPDHRVWLSLEGPHAAVQCRTCHETGTPTELESLNIRTRDHARKCADCHQTPHSPAFVQGNADAASVEPKAACALCHPLDFPHFKDERVSVAPEQHAHGGFPLQGPHAAIPCAKCHAPGLSYGERHTGRRADDCRTCHGDPHGGQFDAGAFAAGGCVGCHARTHFEPSEFGPEQHARTPLPLDGAHAEAACELCHEQPPAGQPRTFHGTPHRCEACHEDAHAGVFARGAADLAANPRGACAECHATGAFANVDHGRFDHARWTGFAVAGAHAQIGCEDCHRPAAVADALGRRFGRVARHGGDFAGCVTCHKDPHEGAFDRAKAPAEVNGRSGCERCHDSASFRALPHAFDHGAFTGFSLQGAHGVLDCTGCHERLQQPTESGRTWGKAAGSNCAACHRDRHAGQFERLGATDCGRCHKSATAFATLSFRHNLDSRFPLSDAHKRVACASCHKPEVIDGATVVRYRPLPTECVACHGKEEGGAPGRRRK